MIRITINGIHYIHESRFKHAVASTKKAEDKLETRKHQIKTLESDLTQKESTLQSHKQTLQHYRQQISSLENSVKAKRKAIKDQDKEINRLRTLDQGQAKKITNLRQEIKMQRQNY